MCMWSHFMWRALNISSTALFTEQYKKLNCYKASQIRQMIEFEDHLKPSAAPSDYNQGCP